LVSDEEQSTQKVNFVLQPVDRMNKHLHDRTFPSNQDSAAQTQNGEKAKSPLCHTVSMTRKQQATTQLLTLSTAFFPNRASATSSPLESPDGEGTSRNSTSFILDGGEEAMMSIAEEKE
jgi:hypothetical protein